MSVECKPDRRALNVLLAVLGIEQQELAELMGYRPRYVTNVLNGFTPASRAFRTAFAAVVTELLLGEQDDPERYPAAPLSELVRRRAAEAGSKRECTPRSAPRSAPLSTRLSCAPTRWTGSAAPWGCTRATSTVTHSRRRPREGAAAGGTRLRSAGLGSVPGPRDPSGALHL